MCLHIVSYKWEQKHVVPDTYHYKQWLYKCYKVDEGYIELETEQAKNAKSAER